MQQANAIYIQHNEAVDENELDSVDETAKQRRLFVKKDIYKQHIYVKLLLIYSVGLHCYAQNAVETMMG